MAFAVIGIAAPNEERISHLLPLHFIQRTGPHRLRFGPAEDVFAETFEFLAVAAVDQFVVGPLRREQFMGVHIVLRI